MQMHLRCFTSGVVMVVGVLVLPSVAAAQGQFGIGPRISFVRGDPDATTGSRRFTGGFIRLASRHTAFEISLDYRSDVTDDLTERVKDYPIQVSLLVYPIRTRLAPYLLGGIGWYSQRVERLGASETVLDFETRRKFGYHVGVGAEIRANRHIGLHGDYRYTHVSFDEEDEGEPFPSWIPFAERLNLSHKGSMITWGATFYM